MSKDNKTPIRVFSEDSAEKVNQSKIDQVKQMIQQQQQSQQQGKK